jgi:acyl carrier protein
MADQTELFERLAGVITETLKVGRERVTPESRFVEDLGADSLDMLSLVMQLEDEFGATIADDDAKKLTTVGAAFDHVQQLIAEKATS